MADAVEVPMIKLNNGVEMPQVGLGVFQADAGEDLKSAILTAFEAGYRHIDTAKAYGNEDTVGEAVRESGIPREQIFITTKLWNGDQGYESTLKACDESLKKLGMDYLDLYLIHWPVPKEGKYKDTWKAFEKLYADKKIRAIGVSNFLPEHLGELLKDAQVVPAVNQIELHPHFQQHETREYCAAKGIQVESYAPIKHGGDILEDQTIIDLAKRYDVDPGQIVLRWHVQEGLIVIPKSMTPERIRSNIDLFSFELNDDEMETIRRMDNEERTFGHPATFDKGA